MTGIASDFERQLREILARQQESNSGTTRASDNPHSTAPQERGIERAVSKYQAVPSSQELMNRIGSHQAQPAAPPAIDLPTGPSGGEDIPVLSGIGDAFDFVDRVSHAPAFLGKYHDKNTGLTYEYVPEEGGIVNNILKAIPGVAGIQVLSKVFPSLAKIAPDLEGMAYVEKEYGLSPFEQMRQAFDFASSKEMVRAAQSREGAGLVEGGRAAAQVGLGHIGGAALGLGKTALGLEVLESTKRLFTNDTSSMESVSQLPNVIDSDIRYIREEAAKAAAGEPGDFTNFINGSIDPTWIVLGGPVGKLASIGMGAFSKLPLVAPATKAVVGKVEDLWTGLKGSKLFEPTERALSHKQGENVFDTLTGLFFKGGGGQRPVTEGLPFIKEVRDFINNNPADLVGEWFARDGDFTPKTALATVHKYRDSIEEVLNLYEKKWTLDPESQNVNKFMQQIYETVQGRSYEELFDVKEFHKLRNGRFSLLYKASDLYGAGVETFANFWRPLTLQTRATWLLNNLGGGMAMDAQHYGSAFLHAKSSIKTMAEDGFLADNADELFGASDDIVAAGESLYGREGYGLATGSVRELPGLLKKIPLLSNYMEFIGKNNQKLERYLHGQSMALSYDAGIKEQVKKIVSTMPPDMQPFFEGAGSGTQLIKRMHDLTSGTLNYANHIPYGKMNLRTKAKVVEAVGRAERRKGGPLEAEDIRKVLNEDVRASILSEGVVKRANAMSLDEFGLHDIEDAMARGGLEADAPIKKRVIDYINSKKSEAIRSTGQLEEVANYRINELTSSAMKRGGRAKVNLKTELTQEGLRLSGIRAEMEKVAQSLHNQALKDRPRMNAITWQKSDQIEALKRKFLAEGKTSDWETAVVQKNRLWEDYWTKQRQPYEDAFYTHTQSLHNIAQHGIIMGWSSNKTSKLMSQWAKKDELYALPDEIANKIELVRATSLRKSRLTNEEFDAIAEQVGIAEDLRPGKYIDYVKVMERDVDDDLKSLDDSIRSFNGTIGNLGRRIKNGKLEPLTDLEAKLGRSVESITNELRERQLVTRDLATLEAKKNQMDYLGGRIRLDDIMGNVFPFWFWTSRYMVFQAREAARNPQQAYQTLRLINNWMSQNEDKAPWDRMAVTGMVMDAGTDKQLEVNFNPAAMLYPMGFNIANVVNFTDPNEAKDVDDAFNILTNFMGGGMWPHIPVLAGQLGLDVGGGPHKDLDDAIKSLAPPLTLARQAVNAIPGMGGSTLGLLTDAEVDQVVNDIRNDANAGLVTENVAHQAAVSVKLGRPNELALQYVEKVAPERLGRTLISQQIGTLRGEDLSAKATREAYKALESAKTEAERDYIYEHNPGIGISITGKHGDELEKALIHVAAPTKSPLLRSLYYQQMREKLDQIQARLDAAGGQEEEVAKWKLRSATPESFDLFRAAGGSAIMPNLTDYWTRGEPLTKESINILARLYDKYGMGSLSFNDWKDKILPDAYMQWVLRNKQVLKNVGVGGFIK